MAVSLAACAKSVAEPSSTSTASAAVALTGTLWKLQSFQRTDSSRVDLSNTGQFTLQFADDGKVAVRADCNRCASSYSQNGTAFAVNPSFACTRAACASAPFDYEYVTALGGTTSARVNGNTLECVSAQGVLTFVQ